MSIGICMLVYLYRVFILLIWLMIVYDCYDKKYKKINK